MRGVIRDFRSLPDLERLEKLGESVLPIMTMSGIDLRADRPETGAADVQTPFGPLTAEQTMSVDRVENGFAEVSSVIRVPVEQMQQLMQSVVERLGRANAPMPALRIVAVENKENSQVSLETGLARRYRSERTMELETEGRRERVGLVLTIERAD